MSLTYEASEEERQRGLVWVPGDPCICECGAISLKRHERDRTLHSHGCGCASHRGKRNRVKGQAAQAKGHRALGGQGFTPGNEESIGGYPVVAQVEHKTGAQVPASFRKFIDLDWTRRAFSQANRARRVGDGSMPAVMIDGRYLVVDCKRGKDSAA